MGDTRITGKIVTVKHSAQQLYGIFSDLRNFAENLPDDIREKSSLEYDSDHLLAKVQGFELGIKIEERDPFNFVKYIQHGNSPISFEFWVRFTYIDTETSSFQLELDAQLGTMMKMMLGNKLQEAIDKLTNELEKRLS